MVLSFVPWKKLEPLGIKHSAVSSIRVPAPKELQLPKPRYYSGPPGEARFDEKGVYFQQPWFVQGGQHFVSALEFSLKKGGAATILTKSYYGSVGEGIKAGTEGRVERALKLRKVIAVKEPGIVVPLMTTHEGTLFHHYVDGRRATEEEFEKIKKKLAPLADKAGLKLMDLHSSQFIRDARGRFHWIDADTI